MFFPLNKAASLPLAWFMHSPCWRDDRFMNKLQSSYRVEVSGWDASENFFVEKATLEWRGGEQKEISLPVKLHEGCVLFVRLLQPTAAAINVPIAYQAAKVANKDSKGFFRVCLAQLRPRDRDDAAGERLTPSIRA
jgi:hypothetical protein